MWLLYISEWRSHCKNIYPGSLALTKQRGESFMKAFMQWRVVCNFTDVLHLSWDLFLLVSLRTRMERWGKRKILTYLMEPEAGNPVRKYLLWYNFVCFVVCFLGFFIQVNMRWFHIYIWYNENKIMHLLLIYDYFSVCLFALSFIQIRNLAKKKSWFILSSTLAISIANIKSEDPGKIFSLRSPSGYSILLASGLWVSDH